MNGNIFDSIKSAKGQIAVLVDPDKVNWEEMDDFLKKIHFSKVDYLFIGGSIVQKSDLLKTVAFFKKNCSLPVVLFPGDVHQVSEEADALLYLSLLSGRNPDYLIGQHIRTAKEISDMELEVIPTAYLLIDGNHPSAVAHVSQTTPIPQNQISLIESTLLAGKLQGKSLVYLDAGSGAKQKISGRIIESCSQHGMPLIVGGGIRSIEDISLAKKAGANVIVIGNHIEENADFLMDIANYKRTPSK